MQKNNKFKEHYECKFLPSELFMFIVAAIFLWRLFLYCDIVTLFLQSRKQINTNSHRTCSVLCVFLWSSLSLVTYTEVISERLCLYMNLNHRITLP